MLCFVKYCNHLAAGAVTAPPLCASMYQAARIVAHSIACLQARWCTAVDATANIYAA
jgi:hypothetical protein